jgi:hypothetical protein
MRALACAAAAVLLCGCPDGLEHQSSVTKLRVLAVRAEPSELVLVPDGGLPKTVLTALAVEPSGAPIAMSYALCEILGTPAAQLDCPGDAGIDLADAGPLSATLDLADPRFLAFAAGFDGGAGFADAGGLLAAGVPLVVGFTATAPAFGNPDGGPPAQQGSLQRLDGFATVIVRTGGPANVNPALEGLQIAEELDGGLLGSAVDARPELQLRPGETVHLIPLPGPKDDPSKRYGFTFFVTDGSTSSLRSTDTTSTGQAAETWVEWTTPLVPQTVRIWVVVRDGRGGTAWIERSVAIR